MSKKTILILASNPRGDLRIDREIRDLTAAIERSKNSDEYAVVIRLAVRPGDLHNIFDRNPPHIVHFSGHGEAEPISLTQNAIANPRSFTVYMFDPDVNSLLSNNSLWFEFQSASKSIKS